LESNHVATGTTFPATATNKKLIYKSEITNKLDFSENDSGSIATVSTLIGSPEKLNYKTEKKNNKLFFSKNISVSTVDEFPLADKRGNLPIDNELESESEDALANDSCIFSIPVEDVGTAQRC